MKLSDILQFSLNTLRSYPIRSFLIVLAMALGVAAVVVLTALGDGARRYVIQQFSSIGTNLIVVLPGRAETAGSFPGAAMGQTPRELALEDARWLGYIPQIRRYAPLNVGAAELAGAGRLREVTVLGSTVDLLPIRHMELARGSSIKALKIMRKLYWVLSLPKNSSQMVMQWVKEYRLADRRFIVSGVLASQGETMGFNSDEIVIIPIYHAQALFNTTSLFRILIEVRNRSDIPTTQASDTRNANSTP